ncbi:MAG TPA: Hpt domain-containing protein [Caulobacteraceae bacterium]|jgi:two-component system chemotaxis sensor kinase CheA
MTAQRPARGLSPETLAAIRIVFFQECEAHLADLEAGLVALRNGERNPKRLDGAYRAAHSIKGGAGIFQLDALVQFSHQIESALGEVRDGRLAPGPEVLGVLSRASNLLAELVEAGRDRRGLPAERMATLGEDLAALAPRESEPKAFDALNFEPRPMAFQPLSPRRRVGGA